MGDSVEKTLEVRLPVSLLQWGWEPQEIQQRITEWLVISLFTEGRISSGRAARLLKSTRIEFLSMLHSRGIAYFHYTEEELAEEWEAVESLPEPHSP